VLRTKQASEGKQVMIRLGQLFLVAALMALLLRWRVPLCPLAFWFHLPCPGCGMTRASLCMLRGDFATAMRFHPLSPVLFPVATAVLAANSFAYVRTGHWGYVESFRYKRAIMLFTISMVAIVIAVWAMRFLGYFGGPVPVGGWSLWSKLS
jgi:Protein of unknown function (DUF2752)